MNPRRGRLNNVKPPGIVLVDDWGYGKVVGIKVVTVDLQG
jgi:hypothetical protein